jgi:hypothetical protein
MIQRLGWGAIVVAVVLAVMSPLLNGDRYAFRDVSHFYLPLYDYVAERMAEDGLPLWNPLDHMGIPLIGESSTAVLYPPRAVLFALPISSELAMNVYLLLHVLLAAGSAAWLARRIGCLPFAAAIAALGYALSGSVFFLCCNPPFLVSSAWLPVALVALLASDDWPLRRRIAIGTFALAMMILGGDPQTAVHVILTVLVVTMVRTAVVVLRHPEHRKGAWKPAIALAAAGCFAVGLTALQIAASVDWSRQSDRVGGADWNERYDFSFPPWHALELVSSRPFGHFFPTNRRIGKLIAGEGRMWTPSIYAGMVVGLAFLLRVLRPKRYFADPWFMIALISLLTAFGHFGFVWLLQQGTEFLADRNSAIGGPYWLLCQLVPGYEAFRYPAKWLPMFAIAAAMMSGKWVMSRQDRHENLVVMSLLALMVAGLILTHVAIENNSQFPPVPPDEYWGPLDVRGGFLLSRASWLWSILVLLLIARVRVWMTRSDLASDAAGCGGPLSVSRWAAAACLLVVAADTGCNAFGLIPRVSIARETLLARKVEPQGFNAYRTLRTQTTGIWPDRWRGSHQAQRVVEVAASERIAWFGRWHLAERRAVFNSMTSIQSRAVRDFWSQATEHLETMDQEEASRFWAATRRWLAIDGALLADERQANFIDECSLAFVLWDIREGCPPMRVVDRWESPATMEHLVDTLVNTDTEPLPHVGIAVSDESGAANPEVQIVDVADSEKAVCEVRSDGVCLLERRVYQDGNWKAFLQPIEAASKGERSSTPVPVVRSSELNQAVRIPPGQWRVTFAYRPWWLWPAITVMTIAWVGWLLLVWPRRKRTSAKPAADSESTIHDGPLGLSA